MSLSVEMLIERIHAGARGIVGDDGRGDSLGNRPPEVVGVIGGIGNDRLRRYAFNERSCLGDVSCPSGGEDKALGTSQVADEEMDLGRQAATRASDGLIASPLLLWRNDVGHSRWSGPTSLLSGYRSVPPDFPRPKPPPKDSFESQINQPGNLKV